MLSIGSSTVLAAEYHEGQLQRGQLLAGRHTKLPFHQVNARNGLTHWMLHLQKYPLFRSCIAPCFVLLKQSGLLGNVADGYIWTRCAIEALDI